MGNTKQRNFGYRAVFVRNTFLASTLICFTLTNKWYVVLEQTIRLTALRRNRSIEEEFERKINVTDEYHV